MFSTHSADIPILSTTSSSPWLAPLECAPTALFCKYLEIVSGRPGTVHSQSGTYSIGTQAGGRADKQKDSGASSSGKAFFEVKTYQPGNTRYNHNHSDLKPADRRARDITSE